MTHAQNCPVSAGLTADTCTCWPAAVNPVVQFEIRGARGIGKTTIVERIIMPALEAKGYKVRRTAAERWEFDVRDGPRWET